MVSSVLYDAPPKALQTARCNLVQRLDQVLSGLKGDVPDPWVCLYLVRAIEHLKHHQ